MLQRIDPQGELAVLDYGPFSFEVVRPGRFVRCAVTGALIPLDELRYWNHELQEAYRGPAEALQRWRALKGKK
ncbi:MAG TPA: DUF2093 domain-containing protein [Caulobacterales bacterium]|nr:DUF2093 domain-containing protein [Caulobacterales bacterium]